MEPNAQSVAQVVREYLQGQRPSGLTLEVVEDEVRKIDTWWQVPVRPSAWPEKTFELYDTLAEVETAIQEDKHLNILLAPTEPKTDQYAA